MQMQQKWREYVRAVYDLCPVDFWRVFRSVQLQSGTCADKVLKTVHNIIDYDPKKTQRWPLSKRSLRSLIQKQVGTFWGSVTITKTINLSHFQLPGLKKLTFSFVDPIYVWLQHCCTLYKEGHVLQWRPQLHHDDGTTEPMYGSGIQFGLLFREAFASIPKGGDVALINLSWDSGATPMKSRSAVPICIQARV